MVSRSARITFLLVLDVLFFVVELSVGHAVGSLALVADSFHMLNDVMSLIVSLYAIQLTASGVNDSRYSYGWHRAEILAALINGVFLLALCFSIVLEALGRFFRPDEISNPRLIVIVGSFGLASNILGLFLFHEHSHPPPLSQTSPLTEQSPLEPLLTAPATVSDTITIRQPKKRTCSSPEPDLASSLCGHPAATRASLVQTAHDILDSSPPPSHPTILQRSLSLSRSSLYEEPVLPPSDSDHTILTEDAPLLPPHHHTHKDRAHTHPHPHGRRNHDHSHGHAHSHSGSMNIRGLILHVLGDALGNAGVIFTGLIIWLTDWPYKYYFDPIISLVISIIIFSSALPLVRSASFILLQGVPAHVSLDEVRQAIHNVDGVLGLHELHVWQLSESKIIASVHVLVADKDRDFMPIAAKIREALHNHGIHSSTIQPEYLRLSEERSHCDRNKDSCLILCPPDQFCDPAENACCPPTAPEV